MEFGWDPAKRQYDALVMLQIEQDMHYYIPCTSKI